MFLRHVSSTSILCPRDQLLPGAEHKEGSTDMTSTLGVTPFLGTSAVTA